MWPQGRGVAHMDRPVGEINAKAAFILRNSRSLACHARYAAPTARPSGVMRFSAAFTCSVFFMSASQCTRATRQTMCRQPRSSGLSRHRHSLFAGAKRNRSAGTAGPLSLSATAIEGELELDVSADSCAPTCKPLPHFVTKCHFVNIACAQTDPAQRRSRGGEVG